MKNYGHLTENMDKFSLYLLVVKIFEINYFLLDNELSYLGFSCP